MEESTNNEILKLIKQYKDGNQNVLNLLREELKGFISCIGKSYNFSAQKALDYSLVPLDAACKNFNLEKENFCNYFGGYLKGEYIKVKESEFQIRFPEKIKRIFPIVWDTFNKIKEENGTQPSVDEIKEELDLSGHDNISMDTILICLDLNRLKQTKSIDDDSLNQGSNLEKSYDKDDCDFDGLSQIMCLTKEEKNILIAKAKGFSLRDYCKKEKKKYFIVQNAFVNLKAKIKLKRKELSEIGYPIDEILNMINRGKRR